MQEPLFRKEFDAEVLLKQHPPQFQHSHKTALFELAYPDGKVFPNSICVTRWSQAVPETLSFSTPIKVDLRPDFYDYKPIGPGTEWHVNFADPRLFVAYGSRLFAQDEMQVAEHPLLGSVREGLLASGFSVETTEGEIGTPILLRNVERRLAISTHPDPNAGRPYGLYGNRFAQSPLDIVLQSTRRIEPPTITNFIAMAAPSYGRGEYSRQEIEFIFATAYTGFSAAILESKTSAETSQRTTVHTGFWGCGAFGGNRTLMVAIQVLAAKAAQINQMMFHAGDEDGMRDVRRGLDAAETIEFRCGPACSVDALVAQTSEMGFRWGVGDGN